MLNGNMNIAEVSLQRIFAVNRICTRRVKHQIDRADSFVHPVDDSETHLSYGVG